MRLDEHGLANLLRLAAHEGARLRGGDLRGAAGAALLRRMQRIGHKLLDEAQQQDVQAGIAEAHSERVVGFHLPPFNSVAHLHLHCLGLPFTPWWQRARFLPHLGTFATVETVLQQVERAADSAP